MSQEQQTQEQATATLPDPKQAYDHLFQEVHANVFFGRLGQAGIQPATEKEAQDLLDLGAKLRVAEDRQKQAAANDGDSFISRASRGLDDALGEVGIDTGIKSASEQQQEASLDQAIEKLAEDPDIYNSVLSLKGAQADEIRAQLESTGK